MATATPISGFEWPGIPYPAFLSTLGLALVGCVVVVVASRYDVTGGLLTVSIMLILATVAATFASFLYEIPQVPSTEILVGALATSLGAIVAHWVGRYADSHKRDHKDDH